MDFSGQYLTYNEYVNLGGTISEETPFNLLEFQARKEIDKYTFGRLINTKISQEVKICVFEIVKILEGYKSDEKTKNIASESIDGYNVSYQNDFTKITDSKNNEIRDIIYTYLANIKLEDGTFILYRGF